MAAVPGMVPRSPEVKKEQDKRVADALSKGIEREDAKSKKTAARPDAFGTAGDFEKSRKEWAVNHPDNKGKERPPIYKPKNALGPAGRSLKGTSAVHGMIPIG